MKRIAYLLLIALLSTLIPLSSVAAQTENTPTVRVVMFWSDTCPHCHYVIEEVLPPIQEQYGEQVEILLVELDTEAAAMRFYTAGAAMGLVPEEMGVPMMIIGDHLLMGSQQIPEELPGLIETYLMQGGVDIPAIAGLEDLARPAAESSTAEVAPVEAASTSEEAEAAAAALIAEEEAGISGSVPAFLVLISLPFSLLFVGVVLSLVRNGSIAPPAAGWVAWSIPVLSLVGLGVAAYLAYVETQFVEAICGPVGDCNAVQSSSYARLFGIPIGLIGVAGYVAILGAWFWGRSGNPTARLLLMGMAVFGVAFSIYLTYLELFVIEAVCMWCLSSAVIMMLIMLAAAAWLAQIWVPKPRKVRGKPARA
jgi:uncharacterized membrane protein